AAAIFFAALLGWRMWQVRGSVEDFAWQASITARDAGNGVTVTWLGTTTLLFDDGETQVLIDGAFTRVGALDTLLMRRVSSDVATINYAMATYQMNRLAAIVPVHSHHDHAMDVGHIANRSTAVVLGSESTAMIARGADVPVDQYQVLASGEERKFGDFTIRLIASAHAPVGTGNREIFPGVIEQPLSQPARVSDYRTGVAWSVLLSHPRGTTLVQGSGGFIEGRLEGETVDVVMLGIAGLAGLGEDYTRRFWDETVTATGASRVIAIHHDDFTAPFGVVRLMPDVIDNVLRTAGWIDRIIAEQAGAVSIELPPFGQPIILY
ncbi:MAG: MBL fold metallo-hydrolase, partial [Gammaproteobacteria bacterium]|nr:MBL fold metallo-hydrolase [Gammaproteobacteria bacterium]